MSAAPFNIWGWFFTDLIWVGYQPLWWLGGSWQPGYLTNHGILSSVITGEHCTSLITCLLVDLRHLCSPRSATSYLSSILHFHPQFFLSFQAEEYIDTFEFEMAHKFCARALEIDPDNTRVLQTSGTLLLELGDMENAKTVSSLRNFLIFISFHFLFFCYCHQNISHLPECFLNDFDS